MKIEIATQLNESTKKKGDLLEKLASDLLKTQNYEVIKEIRFTGVELDLLCKHKINGKEIYVECKAQKDRISAPILTKLLGTVVAFNYLEGWLLSTSEYGKEAKGFSEMWKSKPPEESSKLSFYTPEKIIDSLINSSTICNLPIESAIKFVNGKEFLGDWTLIISEYGRYWGVYTLEGGSPSGVLIYNAENGRHIQDNLTLSNLSKLNISLCEYDLKVGLKSEKQIDFQKTTTISSTVVEVQTGDSWNDYRPSRPEDFIGRDDFQKDIFDFYDKVKSMRTDTRIFAITGNSGLGKSSLIAKIRDRSRNKHYKNRYFTYAVDIRGAKSPAYISSSLLYCFKEAQKLGFGEKIDLQLTDPSSPLNSDSISSYLYSVQKKNQIICLIFDQFEELYSKPELFSVFNASKDLMLNTASFKGHFILGFAWKTDSTTQQDHPAYHMWHELSDYRRVFKLDVFKKGEIAKSITKFEKELEQKIPIEIRHQISNSCQGFPWLLKKLCINIYENLKRGEVSESFVLNLNVSRLFESDLENLEKDEITCIKTIAENSPADWSEMIEISGISSINRLVQKRLVVKSGDRLNIYWDIFKDFLLSGSAPIIPFNYIPTSEINSMLKVFDKLDTTVFTDSAQISKKILLKENTVLNIGADLVMFGLAQRKGSSFRVHNEIIKNGKNVALQNLRIKLNNHTLKISLYKKYAGKPINRITIKSTLKDCLKNTTFNDKTLTLYANKLSRMLIYTGFLVKSGTDLVVQDLGNPINYDLELITSKSLIFSASTSPINVLSAINEINKGKNFEYLINHQFRNALNILKRFNLIIISKNNVKIVNMKSYKDYLHAIWENAKIEPVILSCIQFIEENEEVNGSELGSKISQKYKKNWTEASIKRNGNSLKQWSSWVKEGIKYNIIPPPPGRT